MYSKTEAAYLILKDRKKPMTTKEMVKVALEKKMFETKGKTPSSTMGADFHNENKRKRSKGLPTRFTNLGQGFWSLTEWGLMPLPSAKPKDKK